MALVLLIMALLRTDLTITFFDVGEGAATLISHGAEHVLVDSGNPASAPKLVKKVKKLTGGRLKAFIITHPHQDHIGGVFQILEELKPKFRFDNGEKITKIDEPYRWYRDVFRHEKYRRLRKGDYLRVGKALIEVLSPEKLTKDWNVNSLVLRVSYQDRCAVLMADALKPTEKKLGGFQCKVIQIGHHGSKYASSKEFVDSINAELGIISVNENNLRGYPDPNVIKRWERAGVVVKKTYDSGDIRVIL